MSAVYPKNHHIMNSSRSSRLTLSVLAAALLAPAAASAQVVFSGSGPAAADIQTSLGNFQAALGSLNPNNGSAFSSGRREINWDAVPDSQSDANAFSGNFFGQAFSGANGGRTRGAVFSSPGGLLTSANNPGPNSANARFVNRTDAGFTAFSGDQIFAPVTSTLTEVTFVVPGTSNVAATVSAFGAVFLDVDSASSSFLTFFGVGGANLGSFAVPASGSGGFSFLGVNFVTGERIERVVIQSGNTPLSAFTDTVSNDIVGLDDFIYAEPLATTAVPEPSTYALLGGTFALAAASLRRRRTA